MLLSQHLGDHAVKAFLARFAALIQFVLTGFDRLRFCGESMLLSNDRGVRAYLYQHVRYVDFMKHGQQLTDQLCQETDQLAARQGVPLIHLNSSRVDKEETALAAAKRQPCSAPAGRIAVITAVESCMTYRLRKNDQGQAYPAKQEGRCKHYYHYFQHPALGLCYVRLQTYFPFTVRVGLNGRRWLCQQLQNKGIAFEHQDNLLVKVANPALAQQLFNRQRQTNFAGLLQKLIKPIHPLWSYLETHAPYHWMAEQTEWATDLVFRRADELSTWYERWVRHGIETLDCADVLRYLGKKRLGPQSEVKIDLRDRPEGTRLKFWQDTNSIKFYDKHRTSFRVETTINQPKQFRVYRSRLLGQGEDAPRWRAMSKSVVEMNRRAEVSDAANGRLLESLATVTETTRLGDLLKPLGQPVIRKGKRVARALNPLTGQDGELLRLLARGEFLIRGFRNRDLREACLGKAQDDEEEKRHSAAMTRRLALLKEHGLIVKVNKTHRYHLSAKGKQIVTALLAAHQADTNQLTAA